MYYRRKGNLIIKHKKPVTTYTQKKDDEITLHICLFLLLTEKLINFFLLSLGFLVIMNSLSFL